MTTPTPEPRVPFWRNVSFLKWLFQLVVFAIVAAVAIWLYNNFRNNTAESGIPTNFNFLSSPSSFDIPDDVFEPTERFQNAFVIGVLNTIRVSIVGIIQLGGDAIHLRPEQVGIGTRETARDVARVLSRWVDGIMARTFSHELVEELAREATIPMINGSSRFRLALMK